MGKYCAFSILFSAKEYLINIIFRNVKNIKIIQYRRRIAVLAGRQFYLRKVQVGFGYWFTTSNEGGVAIAE